MTHKSRTGRRISSRAESLSPFRKERYFADNLRFAIDLHGWTLKEAADKFGVRYDWLRRAVTAGVSWTKKPKAAEGEKSPPRKIADYFGCDPELLFDPDAGFRDHVHERLRVDRPLPKQLALLLDHYTGGPMPELLRAVCRIIGGYYGSVLMGKEPDEAEFARLSKRLERHLTPSATVVEIVSRAIQSTAKALGGREHDEAEAIKGEAVARREFEAKAFLAAEHIIGESLRSDPPDPRPYRLAAELAILLYRVTGGVRPPFGEECLPSVGELAQEIAYVDNPCAEKVDYILDSMVQNRFCERVDEQLGQKSPKMPRSWRSW